MLKELWAIRHLPDFHKFVEDRAKPADKQSIELDPVAPGVIVQSD